MQDDLSLVRDHILLPILQTMVVQANSETEGSKDVLTRLKLMVGVTLLKTVRADIYEVNSELRRRKIRVVKDPESSRLELRYRYGDQLVCIPRSEVRAEMSMRMDRYTTELGYIMKKKE